MTIHITALEASPNKAGHSSRLLDSFLQGVEMEAKALTMEINIEKIYIQDLTIPNITQVDRVPNPDNENDQDFLQLAEKLKNSKALVISTPVWNFSVPAQLKQIIDRMGYFALIKEGKKTTPQLKYLSTFFIYTCGGPDLGWWGIMRFTCALGLSWAFRYYGAKICGHMHVARCLPGKGIDKHPRHLKRAEKRGRIFLRKLIKNIIN